MSVFIRHYMAHDYSFTAVLDFRTQKPHFSLGALTTDSTWWVSVNPISDELLIDTQIRTAMKLGAKNCVLFLPDTKAAHLCLPIILKGGDKTRPANFNIGIAWGDMIKQSDDIRPVWAQDRQFIAGTEIFDDAFKHTAFKPEQALLMLDAEQLLTPDQEFRGIKDLPDSTGLGMDRFWRGSILTAESLSSMSDSTKTRAIGLAVPSSLDVQLPAKPSVIPVPFTAAQIRTPRDWNNWLEATRGINWPELGIPQQDQSFRK